METARIQGSMAFYQEPVLQRSGLFSNDHDGLLWRKSKRYLYQYGKKHLQFAIADRDKVISWSNAL